MATSLHIIYASVSGSTEYVVDELIAQLTKAKPELQIEKQRAEQAEAEDLQRGDVLILASGTWNTGGQEGQLSPAMHQLLRVKAEHIQLNGKPMAFISLGDERYYFTTRCTEHFMQFMLHAGGKQLVTPLIIVNEPYEQGEKIQKWTEKLVEKLSV